MKRKEVAFKDVLGARKEIMKKRCIEIYNEEKKKG